MTALGWAVQLAGRAGVNPVGPRRGTTTPSLNGDVGWRRGEVVVSCSRACPRFPRFTPTSPPTRISQGSAWVHPCCLRSRRQEARPPVSAVRCRRRRRDARGSAAPFFASSPLCPIARHFRRAAGVGGTYRSGRGEPVNVSTWTLCVFTTAACGPTRPGEGVGGGGEGASAPTLAIVQYSTPPPPPHPTPSGGKQWNGHVFRGAMPEQRRLPPLPSRLRTLRNPFPRTGQKIGSMACVAVPVHGASGAPPSGAPVD